MQWALAEVEWTSLDLRWPVVEFRVGLGETGGL